MLYDGLAPAAACRASATLDITHHPVGNALKRPFGTAFEYSDCVVDDSRLVVLTALDAAERGAAIRTGARCVRADRTDIWRLAVVDRGHRRVVTARALANATGGWTAIGRRDRAAAAAAAVAAMQMSQIIVRRLFESDNVYVFQNSDGRLIFASPYRARLHADRHGRRMPSRAIPPWWRCRRPTSAISATPPTAISASAIEPSDVVRTVSGVNLSLAPGSAPRATARCCSMRAGARRRC